MLKTDRRKLMALLGGAAASSISWPLAVNAQSKLPVIGWINMRPRARVGSTLGFVDGLRDAGLVEDRDFIIDYRSADEQYDRLRGSPPSSFKDASRSWRHPAAWRSPPPPGTRHRRSRSCS
jgi:hypothetical protein